MYSDIKRLLTRWLTWKTEKNLNNGFPTSNKTKKAQFRNSSPQRIGIFSFRMQATALYLYLGCKCTHTYCSPKSNILFSRTQGVPSFIVFFVVCSGSDQNHSCMYSLYSLVLHGSVSKLTMSNRTSNKILVQYQQILAG